ncbi:MAG: ribonuclease HI family protein [Candidatus Dependentiae bacterium]|nr:ribonuclease HI family protein [Candidatus Dependentiae bacterium]
MKQLKLFDNDPHEQSTKKTEPAHWKLFIDGASRNNPGPSGAGIYILKDSELFQKHGFYLGSKTNNQAEYFALLLGLFIVKQHMQLHDTIHIISDSQLLVRQIKGEYRVKNEDLKTLHKFAKHLLHEMHAQMFHVLRIDNQEADEMANYGIDKKVKPPQAFIAMIKQHDVSL